MCDYKFAKQSGDPSVKPLPSTASVLTLKALVMCKYNLDLTPTSLYKETSLLYWSHFKKDAGLQDLVKLVSSAHSAISLESNLQICQAYINRRISLEMGPEVTRSFWGFNHRNKDKSNVNSISMPSTTLQPVVLHFFSLCSAEGLHTYPMITMAVILKSGEQKA